MKKRRLTAPGAADAAAARGAAAEKENPGSQPASAPASGAPPARLPAPALAPAKRAFAPFKPPLAGRQDANGACAAGGTLGLRKRVLPLGPGGLLGALSSAVVVGRRPEAAVEGAPRVVLFDPAAYEEGRELPPFRRAGAAAAPSAVPPAGAGAPGGAPPPPPPPPLALVEVDAFLAAKLRPHQVLGVQFVFRVLAGVHDPRFRGCIQADSMGLGKTFQSICVMWVLLTRGIYGEPTCARVLILTPSSLVANWGREIAKWLGDRVAPSVLDDSSGPAVKRALAALPPAWAGGGRARPLVVVASYTTFRLHQKAFASKGFELLICDEAHCLKNDASQINVAVQALPTTMRLLLSGTPIQNDLSELRAMFETAVPGLFGTPAEFRRTYENPILAGRDAGATGAQVERGAERAAALVELCGQYMLRRAGAVLRQYLPPKVQEVIFCRMAPLQAALYRGFLASAPVAAALEGRRPADRAAALATLPAITALKKLCCHPDLVYGLAGGEEGAAAAGGGGGSRGGGGGGGGSRGGGGSAGGPVVTGFEGLRPVYHSAAAYPAYRAGAAQCQHSGKLVVLEALLKAVRAAAPGDKVVLVSNYTETLDLFSRVCGANGWAALRLDGSQPARARQGTVDAFNRADHPSFVLLLSSKAGGTGLNIVGANRLVLMDSDWNPANDLQAMARVWREGQAKRVFIYRLLTAGSIEEKIYQRQLSKEGLSRAVVDDGGGGGGGAGDERRAFSRDELRALFRVDPAAECDTHAAIKCGCAGDGAPRAGAGACAGAAPDDVAAWAHTRDVAALPDAVWGGVSDFVRSKYVSFAFSDHNLAAEGGGGGGDDDNDAGSEDGSIDRAGAGDDGDGGGGDEDEGWSD